MIDNSQLIVLLRTILDEDIALNLNDPVISKQDMQFLVLIQLCRNTEPEITGTAQAWIPPQQVA